MGLYMRNEHFESKGNCYLLPPYCLKFGSGSKQLYIRNEHFEIIWNCHLLLPHEMNYESRSK